MAYSWKIRTAPPGSQWSSAGVIGGILYGLCQISSAYWICSYNPATGLWTQNLLTTMSAGNIGSAIIGGKMYWIDGAAATSCAAVYDPATNTATKLALMLPGSSTYWETATTDRTYLFSVAGYRSGSSLNALRRFDPVSNSWTVLSDALSSRAFVYAEYIAGSIYLTGGGWTNLTVAYNSTWAFSLTTNTYSDKATGPLTKIAGASSAFDGNFHIMGGWVGSTAAINLHYVYNVSTDSWAASDSLPLAFGLPLGQGGYATGQGPNPPVYLVGAVVGGVATASLMEYSDNPLPAIPVLVLPANGSNPASGDVTFEWDVAVNATSYELQVATDAGFTDIVDDVLTPGTLQLISGLILGTPYYWRVKSINDAGSSNWSAVWGIWNNSFARRPEDAYLRNATVFVDLGDGAGLQDVGLVGDALIKFEPVNNESPSGDITMGYKVIFNFKRHQTWPEDLRTSIDLSNRNITTIEFRGDADKASLSNVLINPEPDYDLSGSPSQALLTGWKRMSPDQAANVLQSLN